MSLKFSVPEVLRKTLEDFSNAKREYEKKEKLRLMEMDSPESKERERNEEFIRNEAKKSQTKQDLGYAEAIFCWASEFRAAKLGREIFAVITEFGDSVPIYVGDEFSAYISEKGIKLYVRVDSVRASEPYNCSTAEDLIKLSILDKSRMIKKCFESIESGTSWKLMFTIIETRKNNLDFINQGSK